MSEKNEAAIDRVDPRRGVHEAGQIPASILGAIAAAARNQRAFEIARGLCAEDAGELRGDEVPQGRLEHAIARALLDSWARGQGSADAVGSAYALLADCVVNDSSTDGACLERKVRITSP